MKEIRIVFNIKEMIGLVLILILLSFSFSYMSQAKFNIGTCEMKDTLAGDLKLTTGGLFATDNITTSGTGTFGTGVSSPAGYSFSTADQNIDDDGSDLKYFVNSTSKHYFQTNGGSKDILTIDSLDGIKAIDHLTIGEVSGVPRITQDTEVKIYMKNDKLIFYFSDGSDHYFYLDLGATTDQSLVYSGTEP